MFRSTTALLGRQRAVGVNFTFKFGEKCLASGGGDLP
jgi:hypothetical protein